MHHFRPNIDAYSVAEFVPGVHFVAGAGVHVTENFIWALREVAADVPTQFRERLDSLCADVISRCAGLRDHLPRYPEGLLLPYRVAGTQDPTPLPLLLCDFHDSILFGVLSDATPET